MLKAIEAGKKLFAILIDPEDFDLAAAKETLTRLPDFTTHIFVGGSTACAKSTQATVQAIKKYTELPVLLFPGDHEQITAEADALLFLSLISGDNPEYLIHQQVKAVEKLKDLDLEIIPTGYVLIDGGNETAVQRVSKTIPIAQDEIPRIVNTALAGEYTGKKMIYLEAGSGAKFAVNTSIVKAVRAEVSIPVIVGGGIRNREQIKEIYDAGADLIVVGTAFENDQFSG